MPRLSDAHSHPTDQHVGVRLRMRRREAGLTQAALAEALGLTFQQIQKYERGVNRVSASKLFEAAHVLGVSVGYFFEGLPTPVETSEAPRHDPMLAFAKLSEAPEIMALFTRLEGPLRRRMLDLARALVEPDPATPRGAPRKPAAPTS